MTSAPKDHYVLLTSRPWHEWMEKSLREKFPGTSWFLINEPQDFSLERLRSFGCSKVFIPHWSHIIPTPILSEFECIIFHMTDLPYGRGGSPLQNLIIRGHRDTKISALRAEASLDTGPIYCKSPLTLEGTAREIFARASLVIESMIIKIINENIQPRPQQGQPTVFRRRNPSDGNLSTLTDVESIYDHIRMLDCPGYPSSFLETPFFKLEFRDAILRKDGTLDARVTFIPRK